MKMNILKEFIKVIDIEQKAIHSIKSNIPGDFLKAVKMMHSCKGKLVITGVGKSSIIAQKIAATMVSTGTLAVFMHAGDALHGDLGVVEKNDIVVAIGKSGESAEITLLLPVIKKIGAKIISITANKTSTLAKYSDIVLYTKIEKEACPLNLAPTSSTTAALVVGDALAIILMKMKGFRKRDFALCHPGGKLGLQLLLTVGDIMRSGPRNPTVKVNDSIQNMITEMTVKMSGAVSVVDEKGKLMGLITDFDLRKILRKKGDIFELKIKDIMNINPTYVYPQTKAVSALSIMESRERPFLLMPVVDRNKKVVGMIHVHDILAKGLQEGI